MVKKTLELERFRKYDFPRGGNFYPPHGISQDGKCHGSGRVKCKNSTPLKNANNFRDHPFETCDKSANHLEILPSNICLCLLTNV